MSSPSGFWNCLLPSPHGQARGTPSDRPQLRTSVKRPRSHPGTVDRERACRTGLLAHLPAADARSIEDHAGISPAEAFMSANVQECTAHVLRTLSPREEKIIRMRFGMQDGSEHTLEEVGRAFSVTRERIRQIEAKALRKLRHSSRSQKLMSFFDDLRE